VLGEVEEHVSVSSGDARIFFAVKNKGQTHKAWMSTRNLSWQERMALQVGAMMQLYVSNVEGSGELQVSLKPPSEGGGGGGGGISVSKISEPMKRFAASTTPIRAKSAPAKSAAPAAPEAPPGLLLNTLRTGMKLNGVVSSCTQYAAFVNVEAFRAGKQGSFAEVNGMLHRSDIVDAQLSPSKRRFSGQQQQQREGEVILEKGAPVTVYVKEVFKNSGRFTLTMDPKIEKAQIVEMKKMVKVEGQERRRARRMRRVLDSVSVGDTVTGVVQRVVPEGILVTVSSLGPLNVTGLLGKRDLPKQFEVPPDLKESFQKQLLEQDFAVGRPITCGVLKVNPKYNIRMSYNLKLLFDGLGAMPSDDIEISDAALEANLLKGLDDSEEGENDEAGWEDNDVRDIFNELRGNKPLMSVSDLYDWADVQDMLENGDLDKETIQRAIEEVGASKTDEMSFSQFSEVVEIMQDALDGITVDLDEENEDEDDDEEVAVKPPAKSSVVTMAAAAASSAPKPVVMAQAPVKKEKEEEAEEDNDDEELDEGDLEDEAVEEVAREIFDELRGKNPKVPIKAFKEWSDIVDMQASGYITTKQLDKALSDMDIKKDISFEDFFELVQVLEDIASESDAAQTEAPENATKTVKAVAKADKEEGEDEDDDEYLVIDESEEEEMLRDFYDKLKDKNGKLTAKAFKAWEEVAELGLEAKELNEMLKSIGVKPNGDLTFEQFVEAVRNLDEGEDVDDADDDEDDDVEDASDDDDAAENKEEDGMELDFDGEEMTPEENEEMLQMLFDTLRGSKKTVPVKTFMAWDDVQDMLKDGVLDNETIDILLGEVGSKKGGELNYEQFSQLVTMLDENVSALGDFKSNDSVDPELDEDDEEEEELEEKLVEASSDKKRSTITNSAKSVSAPIDEEEEEEEEDGDEAEISEEDLQEIAKEVYDELRGKSKTLSMKSFKAWEEVQVLLNSDVLKPETLDLLINEVCDPNAKGISLAEFTQLVELLDEAAAAFYGEDGEKQGEEEEGGEEDDEPTAEELEAITREIFDELKSAKTDEVTVKKFKAWEGLKEVLDNGELSKGALEAAIAKADPKKTGKLSFTQFQLLLDEVQEVLDASFDEDDEDDVDEEEDKKVIAEVVPSGKGFGRAPEPVVAESAKKKKGGAPPPTSAEENEALEVATEIFDELRGRKKTLSVKTFKEWGDTQEMIESGALKRSTLEKAIVKVGAADSGEMTLDQFVRLVDIIQAGVDESSLRLVDEDDEESPKAAANKKGITTSKQGKVMSVEDEDDGDDIDWDSEEILPELSEEEEARLVFDTLRGKRETVPLVDFLKWEDVQELLECGALTKDQLATAIENVGLTVEKGDLSFESFQDLIDVIDGLVDQDKLPSYDDDDEEVRREA